MRGREDIHKEGGKESERKGKCGYRRGGEGMRIKAGVRMEGRRDGDVCDDGDFVGITPRWMLI